jgi:hypothetical protein
MFLSAMGVGVSPGGYAGGYVFMFLAAVAGIVATSIAVSLRSKAIGHTDAVVPPPTPQNARARATDASDTFES